MLPAKRIVNQTVSILGRSINASEQMNSIKSFQVDRDTKDLLRQCLIACMNYQSTSRENLEKSKTLVRKSKEHCEISSRSAAFTAAMALKLKKWNDVDEMLSFTDYSPPAIQLSIRISALSQQSKLDEALQELEKCLMIEENVFHTENYCVSDESLDTLCEAIKSEPNSTNKMKRFRNLQRLVTKYNRRTTKSIEELLYSPLKINQELSVNSESETIRRNKLEAFANSETFAQFVKEIPHFDENKQVVEK